MKHRPLGRSGVALPAALALLLPPVALALQDSRPAAPPADEPEIGANYGETSLDDLPSIGSFYEGREIDGEFVRDGKFMEVTSTEFAAADELFWQEEAISNELFANQLLALKVRLLGPYGGASSMPPWEDIFTEDAKVYTLDPEAYEDKSVSFGVVKRTWAGEPRYQSVQAYSDELDAAHRDCERVRWALFKPAEVHMTDYGVEVKLKYRFNREMRDGGLRHDHGYWKSEWVKVDGEWRCRKLMPKPGAYTLRSDAPHFVDSTLEAFKGTYFDPRMPKTDSGTNRGLALEDLDGDDDLDLVVMNPVRVLYNRGDGTFEDRTDAVVPPRFRNTNPDAPHTATVIADFDRDGDADFLCAGKGIPMVMFSQQDDGTFRAKAYPLFVKRHIAASMAVHDVDEDGWPDVFVCGYGPFINPGPDDPTNGTNARENVMLRNLGGMEFENVTARWGLLEEGTRWAFTGAFGDGDEDGDIDLYVANDFGPNVLYRMVSKDPVRFEAELESENTIGSGFSMSATWADLDNDLDNDMYVSNMASTAANRVRAAAGDSSQDERIGRDINSIRADMSRGNAIMWNNDGELLEADKSYGAKGASWAWGTGVFDYDCDGDIDIHVVNGFWTEGADDGRDL